MNEHLCNVQGSKRNMAYCKQVEVMKAAKSLFIKRSRTLYRWLNPDFTKKKLDETVSAAWDTLPDNERYLYIAEVTIHSVLF